MPIKKFFGLSLIILISQFYIFSYAQSTQSTNVRASVPIDMDGDGIPNWWELRYELNPTDPNDAPQDADGDGLTNLEEYIHKTNPYLVDTDGGGLSDFDEVMVNKNPTDSRDDDDPIRNSPPPSPQFDKRGDTDGDGVSDLVEDEYGTSRDKIDSDNDGLNDYDEIFKYHTNPIDPDTDKDGLLDGAEITLFLTNPNVRDSDYDGLTDSEEVFTYKTSPLKWDTDEGGVSDLDEVYNQTNPLLKDDDFQLTWTLYYGNKPNNLFQILGTSKITILEGMPLNLEAIKASQVKNITIKFNGKEFSTSDELIEFKLLTPDKVGVYTLEILLELNSGKIIRMTRFIEIRQRGQIFKRLDSKFENLYKQTNYFEDKPVENAEVTVYEYNNITQNLELYNSDLFSFSNPMFTDSKGKYMIPLKPGNYLIKIKSAGVGDKEVLFNTDVYTLYSENIYIDYNYDLAIWGSLFTLIFVLVWESLNIIQYTRFLIYKILELIAKRRPSY